MVVLRPTRKLGALLPTTNVVPGSSDTALGDWYVNRIIVNRQPLLLMVSSTSLLPILIPAREVRDLPRKLASIVEGRLRRYGINDPLINAEIRAMAPVAIAPTADRSVLGIMVDFAKLVPFHLEVGRLDEVALQIVEDFLAENPCHAGRSAEHVIFPREKAPELLRAKWLDRP